MVVAWPGQCRVVRRVTGLRQQGGERLCRPRAGPGAGAFGIFAVICFGVVFAALANAVAGALILVENKPAFAEWFRARKFIGCLVTALAAIPIGAAMGIALSIVLSVFVGVTSLFNR